MPTNKELLFKGIKKLAWALPFLFIGPTLIHFAFINKLQPSYYFILGIGISTCLGAMFFMFLGLKTIVNSLFNDQWNTYQATPKFGLNAFGAQLSVTPAEGFTAYFNLLTGSESGTIVDLTAAYQMSPKFKLGLNAADFSGTVSGTGYSGVALYPSVAISNSFGLGLRAESFKSKTLDTSVSAFTLSANLKSGGLTFIPEIRLDSASEDSFYKSNGNPTKSASQFAVAMVYGF